MEHLYDLKKNSNHVKFFEWLWGINPTIKYKTMCPYFWAFIGSILILPAIIAFKIVYALIKPFITYYNTYSQSQIDEFLNNLYLKLERNSYTDYDLYKIKKSKCFTENYYKFQNDIRYKEDMIGKINESYNNYWSVEYDRKMKAKETLDNFKYGLFGKVIAYIIGLGVLSLAGWGIYELLHLFTWAEFLNFIIKLGMLLSVIGLAVGIIYLIVKFSDKIPCNSFINKIVFWKYIGMFFIAIGHGFLITFDMIKNVYKQNCPILRWS